MAELSRRVVASLTAASVLLMTLYCACGSTTTQSARAKPTRPCCAQRSAQRSQHSPADQHGEGTCQHCKSSVTVDKPESNHAASAFDQCCAVELSDSLVMEPFARGNRPVMATDLPPPLISVTLLSLSCELNT